MSIVTVTVLLTSSVHTSTTYTSEQLVANGTQDVHLAGNPQITSSDFKKLIGLLTQSRN
jgi:hypothetical protein